MLCGLWLISCQPEEKSSDASNDSSTVSQVSDIDSLIGAGEKHFASLKQLTFGGDNAEAYWSFNDEKLVFQATSKKYGTSCDQIFVMNRAGEKTPNFMPNLVSTGMAGK